MLAGDCMGGTPVDTETGAAMAAREAAGGGTRRYIRYIRDLTAGGAVDHHSVLSALPTRATVLPVTKLSASLVRVRGRSARLGVGVG